jgi:hypothetical protein
MPGDFLLLYDNYADGADAVLSAGSWALPLSNLKDPRPSKKARSSSAALVDTKFRIDLGESKSFKALALTNTNLSSAAQYKITRYSDAYTTAIDNTGWLAIPGYPADDPDDIGAGIFHIYASALAARYWQFEFDDTANTDGFIDLGRLFMPACWQPPLNFDLNNSEGVDPNTPRQDSLGRVGYFNRRKPARYFNFAFGRLASSEIATLRRIRKICNVDKQVVVIPDLTDTGNFNEICFLATLKQMPPLALLSMGDASIGFETIEVTG